MEILSIVTNISRYGGAQKVMLDVHNGLKQEFNCKVLSLQSFPEVHPKYGIQSSEFLKFSNPWQLNNKIVIVHARNLLPFLLFFKRILFLNTRIIYVSHSIYDNLRYFTIFPKEIVSISDKVSGNLKGYFGIPNDHISLIYNGQEDRYDASNSFQYKRDGIIKILYPARINSSKRQCELVRQLAGKLDANIELHFAGDGVGFLELQDLCNATTNFKCLGFIDDLHAIISQYDYVMLYSTQEGLPLSLIDGVMHAKPLLINDVGGNLEIGIPEYNGFQLPENWSNLINLLNELNHVDEETYLTMAGNSRKQFLEKFQFTTMIDKYAALIRSIKL